jgi:hypothetical protein
MDFSPLKNQIWFWSADGNAASGKSEAKFGELISRREEAGLRGVCLYRSAARVVYFPPHDKTESSPNQR